VVLVVEAIMKRAVLVPGIFLVLFLITANCYGEITFYNDCPDCTSIKITIHVPAATGIPWYEEELLLGEYNSSVEFSIPHYGDYLISAICLEGIEYSWREYYPYNTGAVDSIYYSCPSQTSTTSFSHLYCPVIFIYGQDSPETELLKHFRDSILSKTREGQELIRLYYLWSPVLIRVLDGDEQLKQEIKRLIGMVLLMLELEEE
jgi:hypothetical protein